MTAPDPLTPDAWDEKLAPLLGLFDVLGRRWALRIVWELRDEPATFRQLQDRTGGASSSVLASRLAELRHHGLVEHERGGGYRLSDHGRGLAGRILDLWTWLQAEA